MLNAETALEVVQNAPPGLHLLCCEPSTIAAIVPYLRKESVRPVYLIRGGHCASSVGLFSECAKVLKFGDYFGQNWDAFDECYCDFCEEASSAIIIWTDCDRLLPRSAREFALLMNVLTAADTSKKQSAIFFQVTATHQRWFEERLRQAGTSDLNVIQIEGKADPAVQTNFQYRSVIARMSAWLNDRLIGPSAASLVNDPLLRHEIEAECTRRFGRRLTYFFIRFACFVALIALADLVGRYFGVPGFGTPARRRISTILLFALICGLGSGVVQVLLERMFHSRREKLLWTIMHERGIPICLHCGYSLAGSNEPRCPECGQQSQNEHV